MFPLFSLFLVSKRNNINNINTIKQIQSNPIKIYLTISVSYKLTEFNKLINLGDIKNNIIVQEPPSIPSFSFMLLNLELENLVCLFTFFVFFESILDFIHSFIFSTNSKSKIFLLSKPLFFLNLFFSLFCYCSSIPPIINV